MTQESPVYSSATLTKKNHVQTILAIIQQKDYFNPDSFICFVMLVGDGYLYIKPFSDMGYVTLLATPIC